MTREVDGGEVGMPPCEVVDLHATSPAFDGVRWGCGGACEVETPHAVFIDYGGAYGPEVMVACEVCGHATEVDGEQQRWIFDRC